MADSARSYLKAGSRLDVNKLDQERDRITQYLQNRGYYRFNKDFITYQVDTMRNSRNVDLIMQLHPYQRKKEESSFTASSVLYPQRRFYVRCGLAELTSESLKGVDSLCSGGVNFFYKDKLFLRPQVISDYNYLQSGKLYRNRDVQNTYSALGRLNILKYSNIRFREELEADSAYLDAYVMLTRNKNKSLSFEIEGTNSAGDLGAAASVAYAHRNLFKGSETFTIKLRGAYEAVTGLEGYANSNYLE